MRARWIRWLGYLDLTSDGSPSFSKLVCLAILVTCIVRDCLTLGVVIALLAASFGRSVFLSFLSRSRVETSERVTREHRTVEITARRDQDLGLEPAP